MVIALIFLLLSTVVAASEIADETDIDSTLTLRTIIKLNQGDVNQKNFAYLVVSSVIDAAKTQNTDINSTPKNEIKACELATTTKEEVNGILTFLNDDSVINVTVTKKDTIRTLIATYYIYYCDDVEDDTEQETLI